MTSFSNILNFLLIANSFILIILILNQNENSKETINKQNTVSVGNPLEKFTWFFLFLEFNFLCIRIKI